MEESASFLSTVADSLYMPGKHLDYTRFIQVKLKLKPEKIKSARFELKTPETDRSGLQTKLKSRIKTRLKARNPAWLNAGFKPRFKTRSQAWLNAGIKTRCQGLTVIMVTVIS